MKTIIKKFEYVAIDFTLVLLIYSIINIKFYTGNVYILELFGIVAAAVCIWNIIGKINFKSYIGFFSIEYLAMYAVTIGGVFALKWYDFTMSNVIILSIEFIVTIAVITYVLVKRERIECDEINELINERMKIK